MLLTSDEPVVAWHPDDEPVTAVTAPVVMIALDRRHLLVMRQVAVGEGADQPAESAWSADEAQRSNSLVATQAHKWIVHHPEDAHLVGDLPLGPRTEWGEEILEVVDEGEQIRVRGRVRRVPRM